MTNKSHKPELLLPAGDIESFFAAKEGGADAVYVGLRNFSARGKAVNFTENQLLSLLAEAKKSDMKVFLTVNTVVKNEELPKLVDMLHFLSQSGINAVIIQDWGVYYIIKKYFPTINVHASTQMANHNSAGLTYAKQKNFDRVILARELTMDELSSMAKKTEIDLEIFIHGALCYSFSGMCLKSSYLGGMGANRGYCTQPCRRIFNVKGTKKYFFSLKDNQQLENIEKFMQLGISSLKVEGRMKSGEYVYRVAKAYRMAIGLKDKKQAQELLDYDMGREKSAYFLSGHVADAITDNPNTGIYLGKIQEVKMDYIRLQTKYKLEEGYRIRIHSEKGEVRKSLKIKKIAYQDDLLTVYVNFQDGKKGDKVFLAGMEKKNFSTKFEKRGKSIQLKLPSEKKNKILKSLQKRQPTVKSEVWVRIDSLKWLRKVHLNSVDGLIFSLSRNEWKQLRLDVKFLQANKHKIYFELPKFISENQVEFYTALCENIYQNGYKNFVLSHLSQKLIIPKKATFITNENVYIYNDAAIGLIKKEGAMTFTYPLENDKDNLLSMADRSGIFPMYFYPQLFYSRMPVKMKADEFKDDKGVEMKIQVRDGITITYPENPVCFFQYKKELYRKGFRRYLIDLSFEKPSQNVIKTLLKRLQKGEQVQPSNNFNFKKGLH